MGGGPVGGELAQVFARFGVATTLAEAGPQLAGREQGQVAERLARVLTDDGSISGRTRASTWSASSWPPDGSHQHIWAAGDVTGIAPRFRKPDAQSHRRRLGRRA
ncbi:MAG: NAD-binding protein [Actinobacteria bacterium]|nr:NAD-binding protein [Actinomycetota bacterium]